MWVYVCVYAHTHTHTAQMGYSDLSPGVGMRHLEGPKNPDGLNLGIHTFVYLYKVYMCIYMLLPLSATHGAIMGYMELGSCYL